MTALKQRLNRSPLVWPAVALVALLAVNVLLTPSFLKIRVQDGHLFGSLIDILRNGAPTMLVALGMTLVIASRGIDLSVGAVVAVSGALTCAHIAAAPDPAATATVLTAMGIALAVAAALGLWNGTLVSVFGVQPIIATLVLMTAGRGIALFITDGQIVTTASAPFKVLGAGYALGLPVAILVSLTVFALVGVLTRRTALGMLLESVGVNPEASRLAGVRLRSIVFAVYVFSALCAGVAGLMIASNISAADANNAGLWIEMDAILAVVIGGTSLLGGRFSLTGTILGALIIQTLTTTVYTAGITPETTLVFKALVVIAVCLLQSPRFRARLSRRRTPPPAPAGATTDTARPLEIPTASTPAMVVAK
ncbi:ribose transporter permease RbsC [Mycolicibacterium phlei]|uniref:Sugar ABC transporter permease n=1 Tax=Mycolicibacterium phlei DSM 43239 = CCUG 21000 TaxID=1226750 RepID=A0A5N5V481_MYCPH|nr:ABC transporter permease [Mycolicibacterium phlei]VEG08498.1 ribose transporter permease RbsC [Mycobacteroides chelonae]AMO60378.1 Inner membrane ABC transporter permease protein YtfT [Mycolicibacterium phlei]KAB7756586.1 sugar ABC transporter permease [Mycolicibacterium phlei DSM 43239 = CCUG 21000]KXW62015.1 sugar ABC transporter permease [Mycolicibacterium phlei DSM 43072]KXW63473.1 sugar ABC transporter permease [Mycolicibacterium phlei DSM 43239 = CCUG 21000]